MTQSPTPLDPALDPGRTALLLMDLQNGILESLPGSDAVLDRAEAALGIARRRGLHVGHVRVAFTEEDTAKVPAHSSFARLATGPGAMHADAPATQVHERIAPAEDDIVVRKTRVGAFSTTDLADRLTARGIDTLVLAGVATSGVVLSTVRDAADRDYRLLVLADAVADRDPEVHAVLLGKVLPRQAEVLTVAELDGRF